MNAGCDRSGERRVTQITSRRDWPTRWINCCHLASETEDCTGLLERPFAATDSSSLRLISVGARLKKWLDRPLTRVLGQIVRNGSTSY